MKKLTLACGFVLLSLGTGSAFAHGPVSCDAPKDEWRPRAELSRELKAKGWSIKKLEIYNGCYEVYGYDEKEKFVEAFFNPKTFERVIPAAE
jgi:hypothetical protein